MELNDEVLVTIIANGLDSTKEISSPITHTERGASPGQGNGNLPSTASEFVHLHNHSEYSMLDGACRIPDMVRKAIIVETIITYTFLRFHRLTLRHCIPICALCSRNLFQ